MKIFEVCGYGLFVQVVKTIAISFSTKAPRRSVRMGQRKLRHKDEKAKPFKTPYNLDVLSSVLSILIDISLHDLI